MHVPRSRLLAIRAISGRADHDHSGCGITFAVRARILARGPASGETTSMVLERASKNEPILGRTSWTRRVSKIGPARKRTQQRKGTHRPVACEKTNPIAIRRRGGRRESNYETK